MTTVEVSHVVKTFAEKTAVDDLSFTVDGGEILGLIGPNGAGKTTTIRMMMEIIRPDAGAVTVRGERGYLPEERGLYRKLTVIDCIVYLASLAGVQRRTAEQRADVLLERTGMLPQRERRIETLSKGMGQLIQFIVAIVHDPGIVILDEPFSGLDPVNAELLKDMVSDLKRQGKTVILSTHDMNDVEELCDRVLMVDKGRVILYGALPEIRSRFRAHSVLLDVDGETGELPGVTGSRTRRGHLELMLEKDATPQELLEYLVRRGRVIRHFEPAAPSLNEIFLKVLEERHE